MNVCTWRGCQMCGRCTDALDDFPEPRDDEGCDQCGRTIGPMTARISLQGVGVFCSRACADAGSIIHAYRIAQRTA